MSKHIFIRPALPNDGEKFSAWTIGTKDNLCDTDPITYRGTVVWCAYDSTGPIVYVPVQKPSMMEALAINPNADPATVAVALKELVQNIVTQCHIDGAGELYFMCTEETTQRFAEKQAFDKLPCGAPEVCSHCGKEAGMKGRWGVYRIKIASLEKPCASPKE